VRSAFVIGGQPNPLAGLEAQAGSRGVPLILGNSEVTVAGHARNRFRADKKPPCDWPLADTHLIGIAHKAGGPWSPPKGSFSKKAWERRARRFEEFNRETGGC